MIIKKTGFLKSTLQKDKFAELYTLSNENMSVTISTYGGYITSILVPDIDGVPGDIALGFSELNGYESTSFAPCGIVGRYANRIKDSTFFLGEKRLHVTPNDGSHHLHGGKNGFHRHWWTPSIHTTSGKTDFLQLERTSLDGEEGYPGELTVQVRFWLTGQNELYIRFLAASNQDTVCNLSNHIAVNLNTCRAKTCLDHTLRVYANSFTPATSDGIPTGEILPVANTVLDFREERLLSKQLSLSSPYTEPFNGYDHNWFLDTSKTLHPCLELVHPGSGRKMECMTTMPCVHIYTANSLAGTETGKYGNAYPKYGAFFTETQYAPDSVNHPEWAQPFLKAGELYDHTTMYRFTTV